MYLLLAFHIHVHVQGPKGPPESIPRENGQFSAPPGGFYAGGPPMRGGEAYGPGRGGFRRRFPLTGVYVNLCEGSVIYLNICTWIQML